MYVNGSSASLSSPYSPSYGDSDLPIPSFYQLSPWMLLQSWTTPRTLRLTTELWTTPPCQGCGPWICFVPWTSHLWREMYANCWCGHFINRRLCPQVPKIKQTPLHELTPFRSPRRSEGSRHPCCAAGVTYTDLPKAKVGNLPHCKVLPCLFSYVAFSWCVFYKRQSQTSPNFVPTSFNHVIPSP